jgi:hypothetical protein
MYGDVGGVSSLQRRLVMLGVGDSRWALAVVYRFRGGVYSQSRGSNSEMPEIAPWSGWCLWLSGCGCAGIGVVGRLQLGLLRKVVGVGREIEVF